MAEAAFSLIYDGPPVQDGTIDARDLAPALLAFADLVDEAAPLVDPTIPNLSLRVRPDFKEGSFEIFLELAGVYSKFVALFGSPDAQAWSAFLNIIGITGALGVFQLIKRAKGRKPTTVKIERRESVTLTFEGDAPIQVDERVWKLFNNDRARQSIEKLIDPLINKGFDLFKIRAKGQETLSVSEAEAAYFKAPTTRDGETISETETRVVIVSPSFNPGNKWRVSDGGRTLYVAIQDNAFELAVQQGSEAFRKGDTLHVTLRTVQWLDNGKLTAEYQITKVHRHEEGPSQTPLL